MNLKKKLIALVLVLAMMLQVASPVFAAAGDEKLKEQIGFDVTADDNTVILNSVNKNEDVYGAAKLEDSNDDGQFYYVALGDSITAGMGTPGADEAAKQQTVPSFMMGFIAELFGAGGLIAAENYKSCGDDNYAYILAEKLFDRLKENGYLGDTATDAALEFDYDVQGTRGKFGWSNLGMAAFQIKDVQRSLLDYSACASLYEFMFSMLGLDAITQAYPMFKPLNDAAKKDGADGLFEVRLKAVREGYDKITPLTYPNVYFTAQGMYGVLTQAGLITPNEFVPETFNENPAAALEAVFSSMVIEYFATMCNHDLLTTELAKADLITINIGSNDLLCELTCEIMMKIWGMYFGCTPEQLKWHNVNPSVATVLETVLSIMTGMGGDDGEAALTEAFNYLLENLNEMPLADLLDLIAYIDPDNMATWLTGFAVRGGDDLEALLTLLRTGVYTDAEGVERIAYIPDENGNPVFVKDSAAYAGIVASFGAIMADEYFKAVNYGKQNAIGLNNHAQIIITGLTSPFGSSIYLPYFNASGTELISDPEKLNAYNIPGILGRVFDKSVDILTSKENAQKPIDAIVAFGTSIEEFLYNTAKRLTGDSIDFVLNSDEFQAWLGWSFELIRVINAWGQAGVDTLKDVQDWTKWISVDAPSIGDKANAFVNMAVAWAEDPENNNDVKKFLRKVGAECAVLLLMETDPIQNRVDGEEAYIELLKNQMKTDLWKYVTNPENKVVAAAKEFALGFLGATSEEYTNLINLVDQTIKLMKSIEADVEASKEFSQDTKDLAAAVMRSYETLKAAMPSIIAGIKAEIECSIDALDAMYNTVIGEIETVHHQISQIPVLLVEVVAAIGDVLPGILREYAIWGDEFYDQKSLEKTYIELDSSWNPIGMSTYTAIRDRFYRDLNGEIYTDLNGDPLMQSIPGFLNFHERFDWIKPVFEVEYKGTTGRMEVNLLYPEESVYTVFGQTGASAALFEAVGNIINAIKDESSIMDIETLKSALETIINTSDVHFKLILGNKVYDEDGNAVKDTRVLGGTTITSDVKDVNIEITSDQIKELLEILPVAKSYAADVISRIRVEAAKGKDLAGEWADWATDAFGDLKNYGEQAWTDVTNALKNATPSDIAKTAGRILLASAKEWLEWSFEFVLTEENFGQIDELTKKAWIEWYAWFIQEDFIQEFVEYFESEYGRFADAIALNDFKSNLATTLGYINDAIEFGKAIPGEAKAMIMAVRASMQEGYRQAVNVVASWTNLAKELPSNIKEFKDLTFEDIYASLTKMTPEAVNETMLFYGDTAYLTLLTWAAMNLTDEDKLDDLDELKLSAWAACMQWFNSQPQVQHIKEFIAETDSNLNELVINDIVSTVQFTVDTINNFKAEGERAYSNFVTAINTAKYQIETFAGNLIELYQAWNQWYTDAVEGVQEFGIGTWAALADFAEEMLTDGKLFELLMQFEVHQFVFNAQWAAENLFTAQNFADAEYALSAGFNSLLSVFAREEFVQAIMQWIEDQGVYSWVDEEVASFADLCCKTKRLIEEYYDFARSTYCETIAEFNPYEDILDATFGEAFRTIFASAKKLEEGIWEKFSDKYERNLADVVGYKEDWEALACKLLTHPLEALTLIVQLVAQKDLTNASDEILEYALSEIVYPVMYLVFGKATLVPIEVFDEIFTNLSEEFDNVSYLPLQDVVYNESNTDPHPNAFNHNLIAEEIYATLDPEIIVNVTVENAGEQSNVYPTETTASGITKFVRGFDAQFNFVPSENKYMALGADRTSEYVYTLTIVKVNGDDVTDKLATEGGLSYTVPKLADDDSADLTDDLTVDVVFTRTHNIYKNEISYILDDATRFVVTPASVYKYDEELLLPTAAAIYKRGYDFQYWEHTKVLADGSELSEITDFHKESTKKYADYTDDGRAIVTYTSVFKPHKYDVFMDVNGGTVEGKTTAAAVYTYDVAYTLPTPHRTGYTFDGWVPTGAGASTTAAITAIGSETYDYDVDALANNTMNLVAKWTPIEYDIVVDLNGGSSAAGSPDKYTYDTIVELKDPSRRGYDFVGWYTTGTGVTASAKVVSLAALTYDADAITDGKMHLEAHWTPHDYDVFMDAKGGTIKTADGNVATLAAVYTYDQAAELLPTAAAVSKYGYSFDGWFETGAGAATTAAIAAIGSYSYDVDALEDNTMNLEARWTPITYAITYKNGYNDTTLKTDYFTIESLPGTLTYKATRSGYDFVGWYTQANGGNKVEAVSDIGDITLYAHWVDNEPYVPSRPSGPVTPITPVKTECKRDDSCPMAAYEDLDMNRWYHDAIHFVLEEGYMSGDKDENGKSVFRPNDSITRAELARMLFNMSGDATVTYEAGTFSDVPAGKWYSNAIAWANKNGIVTGSNGQFYPLETATREEIVTMLHRYVNYKGIAVDAVPVRIVNNKFEGFTDGGEYSNWAKAELQWAIGAGLISGNNESAGALLAAKTAGTRAEIAQMVFNLIGE